MQLGSLQTQLQEKSGLSRIYALFGDTDVAPKDRHLPNEVRRLRLLDGFRVLGCQIGIVRHHSVVDSVEDLRPQL